MLTHEQIEAFGENGYLHLPQTLAPEEVTGLRESADRLIASIPQLPPEWQDDFKYGALVGDHIGEGDMLCRMEYSLQKHRQYLMLLGNPKILAIAATLHRAPIVLTWEDMIIKMPGSGLEVPFHQAIPYQSLGSRVLSIGIYLDDSYSDPLRVLPGSHRLGPLDEGEVGRMGRARSSELVEVPARAGDVIIHNVLAIHGSAENRSRRPRRVIYFEFRTISQVLTDSPWDGAWLAMRLRYIPAAVRMRRASGLADNDPTWAWQEAEALQHYWMPPTEYETPGELRLRVPHDLLEAGGSNVEGLS